jgi:hypothetical protein
VIYRPWITIAWKELVLLPQLMLLPLGPQEFFFQYEAIFSLPRTFPFYFAIPPKFFKVCISVGIRVGHILVQREPVFIRGVYIYLTARKGHCFAVRD